MSQQKNNYWRRPWNNKNGNHNNKNFSRPLQGKRFFPPSMPVPFMPRETPAPSFQHPQPKDDDCGRFWMTPSEFPSAKPSIFSRRIKRRPPPLSFPRQPGAGHSYLWMAHEPYSPGFPGHRTPILPEGARDFTGVGMLIEVGPLQGKIQYTTMLGTSEILGFEYQHFCDQAVGSLIKVLQVGQILRYHAFLCPDTQRLVSYYVAPLRANEDIAGLKPDLELFKKVEGARPPYKGQFTTLPPFEKEKEKRVIAAILLLIFQQKKTTKCSFETFMEGLKEVCAKLGDPELSRYLGMEANWGAGIWEFLKDRNHLFRLTSRGPFQEDVALRPVGLYKTVEAMGEFILGLGGACQLQDLFQFYKECYKIPDRVRKEIGTRKRDFLDFLDTHKSIFSVFPSRVFVSLRREVFKFDYGQFWKENFGLEAEYVVGETGPRVEDMAPSTIPSTPSGGHLDWVSLGFPSNTLLRVYEGIWGETLMNTAWNQSGPILGYNLPGSKTVDKASFTEWTSEAIPSGSCQPDWKTVGIIGSCRQAEGGGAGDSSTDVTTGSLNFSFLSVSSGEEGPTTAQRASPSGSCGASCGSSTSPPQHSPDPEADSEGLPRPKKHTNPILFEFPVLDAEFNKVLQEIQGSLFSEE